MWDGCKVRWLRNKVPFLVLKCTLWTTKLFFCNREVEWGVFWQKKKEKEWFSHQLSIHHIMKIISKSIKRYIYSFFYKKYPSGKNSPARLLKELTSCSGPSSWPVLFFSRLRSAPFRTRCSPREATGVAWPPMCRCSWWTQRQDSPGLLLEVWMVSCSPCCDCSSDTFLFCSEETCQKNPAFPSAGMHAFGLMDRVLWIVA